LQQAYLVKWQIVKDLGAEGVDLKKRKNLKKKKNVVKRLYL
jgi:hypothetical protein